MRKYLLLAVSLFVAALFVAPFIAYASTSILPVFGGGTATGSFTQGWVYSNGTTSALAASTSPTVNYITATSTTATSTYAHGIQAPCFATSLGGPCISGGGFGTVTSVSTNNGITGGTITTSGTLSLDETFGGVNTAASSTWTGHLSVNTATSTLHTISTLWLPNLTASRLLAVDNNGQVIASSTIGVNLLAGILPIANGGTNASSFGTSNGILAYNGTSLVNFANFTLTSTLLTATNASTTAATVSSYFSTGSSALVGIASSSPSTRWGVSIGTTTVVQGAGIANSIASSTTDASTETVNWDNGDTVRYILNGNTNFAINSTSSNPRDGGKYILKICQDPTGSRTATFVTPGQLRWANGTTTISSAANTCSLIGMIYDASEGLYDVVASSTGVAIK